MSSPRRRELVLGDVAEAAGKDPPVGRLLPVVESVAAVVRAIEQVLERLSRDHLAAGRDDPGPRAAPEAR